MKKYASFFRIRFIAGLQYRAAAWAGIATQFAWGMLTVLMYWAFYQTAPQRFPMRFSQLSSYLWMQQALLAMFMPWFFDSEILLSISSGSVAYELCRPCDLYAMWFVKNMAARLSRTALRCLPILLVAAVIGPPFGLSPPPDFLCGALFLLSAALGFLVLVAYSMLIYLSVFHTLSPTGVRALSTSVVEFLSGAVVPLSFFPEALQPFVYALPFASMQNAPFEIYIGRIDLSQALGVLALQAAWLAALTALGRKLMKRSLRRVVIQGG